jgi:hypothetical protein
MPEFGFLKRAKHGTQGAFEATEGAALPIGWRAGTAVLDLAP